MTFTSSRPKNGACWMLALCWLQDFSDGRVIKDGALWDSSGRLVRQSLQLALVRHG
jgi:hypothetical protein